MVNSCIYRVNVLENGVSLALPLRSLDIPQHKPHLPLPAMTSPNTESSSSAITAQSPSLSASQESTVKPGEYPFKRGEYEQEYKDPSLNTGHG